MAKEAGRDPSSLQMIGRANLEIRDKPLSKDWMMFTGTLEQIQGDVLACKRMATRMILRPTFFDGA
jgi:hypothetical protein